MQIRRWSMFATVTAYALGAAAVAAMVFGAAFVGPASGAQCVTCRPVPPPSGPGPLPRLAEYYINWSEFSGCFSLGLDETGCGLGGLPGNDDIELSTQSGAPYGVGPSEIQVVLETPSNITWWKEIKAFDAWGNPISGSTLRTTPRWSSLNDHRRSHSSRPHILKSTISFLQDPYQVVWPA